MNQIQIYESERRKIALTNETIDFIMKNNPPTKEELNKLRAKNKIWNKFPEKACAA